MPSLRIIPAVFAALAFFVSLAQAGELTVKDATIPAPPASAPVAAGYMKITNTTENADRLIGASASFAGMTQVHTMKMEDGVMKMRKVEGGLPIAAGETVVLKKGGLHLMFMRMKEPVKAGETRTVVLEFENSGKKEITFQVK